MMKRLTTVFTLLTCLAAGAQTIRIEDCYTQAKEHYPLIKQRGLIKSSNMYTISNLAAGYLPQLNINGQVTYQSAVTEVPIKVPGIDIPSISKDQYKVYGEVTQVLFDGGMIRQQQKIQETNAAVDEQSLEVELYKVRDRVTQFFFGILMLDEQLKQVDITKSDIESALKKTQAAVDNGTALRSSADILRAEMIKNEQRKIELKGMRKAYTDMLSLFINTAITENTILEKPQPVPVAAIINRPELTLYEKQRHAFVAQEKLINAKNMPRFSLFVQGGAGRPALNMLSNKFEGYYLGGVRLNWSLSGLYTTKKEKLLLDIKKKNIDLQQETFLFNTQITQKQQLADADKWTSLLQSDDEIVSLRTNVKNAAAAQLENGVITSSDYVREVNAEDQAKQNKILHEIQLLLSQYNLKFTTNN